MGLGTLLRQNGANLRQMAGLVFGAQSSMQTIFTDVQRNTSLKGFLSC